METITVEQLLGNVGNLAFTHEDLIMMLSSSDDSNEDFKIVHREDLFVVPVQSIREFFRDHPKPKRKMGKDEELEFLRKKVAAFEAKGQPGPFAKPERKSGDLSPRILSGLDKKPGVPEDEDNDDPLIPEREALPRDSDKRETVDEVQARLGAELRGKKPENKRGRPSGVIKAKLEIPSKG
jgi:hypothetical protein